MLGVFFPFNTDLLFARVGCTKHAGAKRRESVAAGAAVGLHQLRRGVRGLAPEDHEVQQRVGAQAVGAVHRGAARLFSERTE